MYHNPPLLKVEQEEAMTAPCYKGAQATLPHPQLIEIPNELGKCIDQDALLVKDLGWEGFLQERQGRGYFTDLEGWTTRTSAS